MTRLMRARLRLFIATTQRRRLEAKCDRLEREVVAHMTAARDAVSVLVALRGER